MLGSPMHPGMPTPPAHPSWGIEPLDRRCEHGTRKLAAARSVEHFTHAQLICRTPVLPVVPLPRIVLHCTSTSTGLFPYR